MKGRWTVRIESFLRVCIPKELFPGLRKPSSAHIFLHPAPHNLEYIRIIVIILKRTSIVQFSPLFPDADTLPIHCTYMKRKSPTRPSWHTLPARPTQHSWPTRDLPDLPKLPKLPKLPDLPDQRSREDIFLPKVSSALFPDRIFQAIFESHLFKQKNKLHFEPTTLWPKCRRFQIYFLIQVRLVKSKTIFTLL